MNENLNQTQKNTDQSESTRTDVDRADQTATSFTPDLIQQPIQNKRKRGIISVLLVVSIVIFVLLALIIASSSRKDSTSIISNKQNGQESTTKDSVNKVFTENGLPVILPVKNSTDFQLNSYIDGEYSSLGLVFNGEKPNQENRYVFTVFEKTNVPSFVLIPKDCIEGITQTSDNVKDCKLYHTTPSGFKIYHYYERIFDYDSGSNLIETIDGRDYYLSDHYLIDTGEYVLSYESDEPADLDRLNDANLKPLFDSFDFATQNDIKRLEKEGARISI